MPWFAISATTGAPINDASEYWDKFWDLGEAKRHQVDRCDLKTGQTIVKTFGKVSVTYTVTQEMGKWQPGCEYQAKYMSDEGTILWCHMAYNRREGRHYSTDTFTVYPR